MEDKEIRIVGIATSPRKGANTEKMIDRALDQSSQYVEEYGYSADTEIISLAGKKILPCFNEDLCVKNNDYCQIDDDWLDLVGRLIDPAPDGLVFGSPVYFFNQNSLGRAFMERFTSLVKGFWFEDFPHDPPDFTNTAAGAVAVGADRHGGVEHTMSTIIHWLLTMGFVTVGGFYIGGGGWTHEDDSSDAIEGEELSLESASLVGKKIAKTALLLKRGNKSFDEEGQELSVDLWK